MHLGVLFGQLSTRVSDLSDTYRRMGENGKRSRPRREHDGDSKHQKRRVHDRDRDRDRDEKAGDDELIVYRILCPDGFIGSVIGKSGKVINSIRQETRARVKVVDPFPGAKDRVITIYCYVRDKDNVEIDEEFDDGEPLCPAQDALIKVHNAIAEAIDSFGDSDKKWKDKEECKILVPSSQSANIIGKSGATIKRLRSKTRANIKVTPKDASDPTHSCAMEFDNFLVSTDDLKSIAVEAVLLLQGKINDEDDDDVTIRLLVPSKVIGCIIGKSGSIVNEIRKRTKADVHISKGEKPKCADANDELVEVVGKVGSVRDALVQIVLRLRDDVLKDRERGHNQSAGADSYYSGGTGFSAHSVLPSVPPVAPVGYEQRDEAGSGLGMRSSSSLYGYGSLPVGDDGYGSLPSYSSKLYGGLPPPSTLEMVVPGHAVGKVMGKGGANIGNIRKISGAVVEISESKSSRGDRVALISGTPEQKRAAENLIQAFIMAT
ncbi:KH domain-containing protein At4g18375-like isoform X3 [Rhododendron vialii]|uniref:KH domain-containing protein At4g18375-like isoform X3 n=1 Tax=Rhododendron vialii TaxID=182163 RepID=UPI00265E95FB|nr:KH domain-containing protein At4g18375-like isoform X3 [Rhododendron vialii]